LHPSNVRYHTIRRWFPDSAKLKDIMSSCNFSHRLHKNDETSAYERCLKDSLLEDGQLPTSSLPLESLNSILFWQKQVCIIVLLLA
jgi:hypothetical protein